MANPMRLQLLDSKSNPSRMIAHNNNTHNPNPGPYNAHPKTMAPPPNEKNKAANKDNDDKSIATEVATNMTMNNMNRNPKAAMAAKPSFNPWKMANNNRTTTTGIPINTTPLPKDYPFHTRCRL